MSSRNDSPAQADASATLATALVPSSRCLLPRDTGELAPQAALRHTIVAANLASRYSCLMVHCTISDLAPTSLFPRMNKKGQMRTWTRKCICDIRVPATATQESSTCPRRGHPARLPCSSRMLAYLLTSTTVSSAFLVGRDPQNDWTGGRHGMAHRSAQS